MVLGTADAAKWVSRQKNRLPQPRATISTSMAAGRCGRPTAEAAERRLEAGVFAAFQTSDGGSVDFAELLHRRTLNEGKWISERRCNEEVLTVNAGGGLRAAFFA